MRRLGVLALAGMLAVPGAVLVAPSQAAAPTVAEAAAIHGLIRVDQLGFRPGEHKIAYLMLTQASPHLAFTVVNAAGHTVLSGHAGTSTGSWNTAYPAVYPLDVTRLHALGTYRIHVASVGAVSPAFRIASAAKLLLPRVSDIVAFFQAQRDGAHVISGPLHRKPSHLNDANASVYAWPTYVDPEDDGIVGSSLTKLPGGSVDVEGGWFDAGDFIKFAHTAAYTDDLLYVTQRDLGKKAPLALTRETRYGLRWLDKVWDPAHNRMLIQVGIGSGNTTGTFFGDHDSWRLPQLDDSITGFANRYVRNRPVFATDARPGHLAPNLAGRVSAAFALAAQVDAATNPARAKTELAEAAQIYGRAKTTNVTDADVVTALPHAFYPESSWRDDMELGATELARAAFALHDTRAQAWLAKAAFWGQQYLWRESGGDTLNLYDDSAVAHADLVPLLRTHATTASERRIGPRLVADLKAQVLRGRAHAAQDAFGAGGNADDFDVASHTFGLAATAALYRRVTGGTTYDAFATSQRDWVLGDNAWGTSFMIGVGTTYPACPQHVVANLSGSLTGRGNVLRGAVVNGPNDETLFADGLGDFFDAGKTCPVNGKDAYAAFTGHGSRFIDDVRSWQTDEPADDFTATAALAFALQAVS